MPASFGAWLRRNRELRELPLAEVAEVTRLPPRLLEALEADDLRQIPDRAYALQYARSCATAIGLDPDDAALRLEEWMQAQPAATLPPPPAPSAPPAVRAVQKALSLPARISRDPVVWLIVLATVAACAALFVYR
jgi:cytoskeleton protein RodZ